MRLVVLGGIVGLFLLLLFALVFGFEVGTGATALTVGVYSAVPFFFVVRFAVADRRIRFWDIF